MNLRDVSVVVTSFNEESNIARCLAKLGRFGEVVLVDSFSSDNTLEIARAHGATIYQRPYPSAASQKNWALGRIRNDWVLILDADEAVSDGLLRELEQLDESDAAPGYWIRRESEYLGGPIRRCGWQRDKVLRFFRRSRGRYEEREVHEEIVLDGSASVLENRLMHFPYGKLKHHFRKINEYSSRGATDYINRGGRFALLNMILHPPFRFLRMYLLQRGFLDGARGFVLCLLSSYAVFLKYAKAWERKHWPRHR